MSENDNAIQVFLRLKPLLQDEKRYFQVEDNTVLVTPPPSSRRATSTMGQPTVNKFTFSYILPDTATQIDVFRLVALEPLQQYLACEKSALVFSFGTTGSGKTYTMLGGGQSDMGILPRTLQAICHHVSKCRTADNEDHYSPCEFSSFKRLSLSDIAAVNSMKADLLQAAAKYAEPGMAWFQEQENIVDLPVEASQEENVSLWASFVEVYNEHVFDLLAPFSAGEEARLKINNDKRGEAYVKNVRHVPISNAEEAFRLLNFGRHAQRMASTKLNERSSRSHSVFTIRMLRVTKSSASSASSSPVVLGNSGSDGTASSSSPLAPSEISVISDSSAVATGKLEAKICDFTFCDLAGSERSERSGTVGVRERFTETNNINKSITTLRRCIEELRHKSSAIPFRESKITRLLQNFLTGRGKIYMIANISQDENMVDDTLNTLRFASKTSEVVTVARDTHRIALIEQPQPPVLRLAVKRLGGTTSVEDESSSSSTSAEAPKKPAFKRPLPASGAAAPSAHSFKRFRATMNPLTVASSTDVTSTEFAGESVFLRTLQEENEELLRENELLREAKERMSASIEKVYRDSEEQKARIESYYSKLVLQMKSELEALKQGRSVSPPSDVATVPSEEPPGQLDISLQCEMPHVPFEGDLDTEQFALREALAVAQEDAEQLVHVRQQLVEDKVAAQQEMALLQSTVGQLDADKLELEKLLAIAQEDSKELLLVRQQLAEVVDDKVATQQELALLQTAVGQLDADKLELQKLLTVAQEDSKELLVVRQQLSQTVEEKAAVQQELALLQTAVGKLDANKLELQNLLTVAQEDAKQLVHVRQQLAQAVEEKVTAEQKLALLQTTVGQLDSDKLEFQKLLTMVQEDSKELLLVRQQLVQAVEDKLAVQQEVTLLQTSVGKLDADKLELQKLLAVAQEDAKQLVHVRQQLAQAMEEKVAAEKKLALLQTTVGKLDADKMELQKLLAVVQEDAKQLVHVRQQLAQAMAEKVEVLQKLSLLQTTVAQLDSDKLELQKSLAIAQEDSKELLNIRQHLSQTVEEKVAAQQEVVVLQTTVQQLESDKLSLQESLAVAQKQTEELEHIRQQLSQAMENGVATQGELGILQTAVRHLEGEKLQLQKSLAEAQEEAGQLVHLRQQLAQAVEDGVELRSVSEALNCAQQEISILQSSMKEMECKLQEMNDLQQKISTLESEKVSAKQSLSQVQQELANLQTSTASDADRLAKLHFIETMNAEMRASTDQMRLKHKEDVTKLRNEIVAIKSSLEEVQRERDKLKMQLAQQQPQQVAPAAPAPSTTKGRRKRASSTSSESGEAGVAETILPAPRARPLYSALHAPHLAPLDDASVGSIGDAELEVPPTFLTSTRSRPPSGAAKTRTRAVSPTPSEPAVEITKKTKRGVAAVKSYKFDDSSEEAALNVTSATSRRGRGRAASSESADVAEPAKRATRRTRAKE